MIINELDGCCIVFDTKNRNTKLDTLTNNITYASGEVISDGFFMAKDAFGVKRMTLHKDCTFNGRRIADMTKEELDAWIADDGEVYCDTMAIQSMEVSDALLLSKFPSLEVKEEGDEYPHPLDSVMASEIDDTFEELMQTSLDAISDEEYQLKRKIIYDALANE